MTHEDETLTTPPRWTSLEASLRSLARVAAVLGGLLLVLTWWAVPSFPAPSGSASSGERMERRVTVGRRGDRDATRAGVRGDAREPDRERHQAPGGDDVAARRAGLPLDEPGSLPAMTPEVRRLICTRHFREAAVALGLAEEPAEAEPDLAASPEAASPAGLREALESGRGDGVSAEAFAAAIASAIDPGRASASDTSDAGDSTSAGSSSVEDLVLLAGCSGAPVSDDFHATALNDSLWTFVRPLNDGSVSLNGTNALLSLPSGQAHDVWSGANNSIRIMQPISNVDFEVEVKWQSPVTAASQLQGILVEESPGNYLRFDLFHDGSSPRLFAASFVANTPTTRLNMAMPSAASPFWLRVQRTGSSWTMRYSTNGSTFSTAVTFAHTLVASSIGPFCGNAGSPAPAFTSSIDYFFNTASPIVPEDGSADTTPPVLSGISATPTANTAAIGWTTNEPADGRVDYGVTTAYGSTVTSAPFVTSHTINLQGLFCGTLHHYRVSSSDTSGNAASSGDQTFSTSACPTGGPVSDDFHAGSLNSSLWTFVNPLGDGSVSVNGTNALLSLPAGASHDVWTGGNNAIRIVQSTANTGFEVEVKFDSMVAVDHQLLGILVEQDAQNFIRFGIYSDGPTPKLFAASFSGGVPTIRENTSLCVGPAPFWLRVKRVGDTWTQSWSTLGTSFTSGASFNHPLTVQKVGVYAGNVPGSSGPAPAFTASIDYFFNTASPIVPEDGFARPDDDGVVPEDGVAKPGGDRVMPGDGIIRPDSGGVRGSAVAIEPDDPFGPPGPTIDVWYGDTQTFGQNGRPQTWINVLGKVSDADGVSSLNYRLNGAAPQPLSIGPDGFRLVDPGDFNVEIAYASLVPGSNSVLLTAVDGLGNTSTRTVTVNFVAGQTWPASYSINWGSAGTIGAAAQITDGRWAIQPDGTVRTMQTGYDRLITLGDMDAWNSYEVRAEVTISSLDCNNDFGVGIVAGWKGHTGSEQPRVGHPFPGLGWYAKFPSTNGFLNIYENTAAHPEHIMIQDTSGRILHFGVKYVFKFRVEALSASSSRYSLKVWEASGAEPANFDLVATGDRSQGSIVLGAHRADVSFGPVSVTGL